MSVIMDAMDQQKCHLPHFAHKMKAWADAERVSRRGKARATTRRTAAGIAFPTGRRILGPGGGAGHIVFAEA